MARPPRVAGLILCRALEIDPSQGRISLVGVFNHLQFPGPPPYFLEFSAYTVLYGGEGEGTIELVVSRLDTEQAVYRYQAWRGNPAPRQARHMELRLHRCVFPVPGRYGCRLRFDGSDLTWRPLDVFATGGMG
jgi:hypothetical protein